jgi:hypothetical protein
MLVSLAPLFAGRGWGEGLLPQIPKINVRGESPSPGLLRTMLRIARSNPTSPRKRLSYSHILLVGCAADSVS